MVHDLICECKLEWHTDPADAAQVKGPDDAADVITNFISDKPQEHLIVLLLSNQNAVVGVNIVAIGTGNACRVQVADVLRPAILANANGIILAHNHPSGSINPSPEDRELTIKIKAGADLMGIDILDHIIVGSYGNHLSMREQCEGIF
jgi:DNA repair protein RadC